MTRMDIHQDYEHRERVKGLCDTHLDGNHFESHKLVGFILGAVPDGGHLRKLLGHAARGQIDLTQLREWHDALASEKDRRGQNHDSPMTFDFPLPIGEDEVTESAVNTLEERCPECDF